MRAGTRTRTTMADAAHLLRLLAWLSPAFPTGGYAYSHGLEWAVEAGDVRDGDTLRDWLGDVLAHGSGRNDAILLRHAHRACDDKDALADIAALASATAPGRERRNETRAQGAAFTLASAPWAPHDDEGGGLDYPVAVGALAGAHGVAEDDAAIAFLHAFMSNLISAAVRLVPLGQSVGLAVLSALEPTILRVADGTRAATLDDIGGCVFRADIASLRHETQYTRLFRS
jgi:urease accessory protein